jgi:hypothetical protein
MYISGRVSHSSIPIVKTFDSMFAFSLAVMKSSLVVAGLGDLMRPADKLSLNQSISLAATGLIWSRVRCFSLNIRHERMSIYLVLHGYHTEELFSWYRQFRIGLDRSSTNHTYCSSSFYTSRSSIEELVFLLCLLSTSTIDEYFLFTF